MQIYECEQYLYLLVVKYSSFLLCIGKVTFKNYQNSKKIIKTFLYR